MIPVQSFTRECRWADPERQSVAGRPVVVLGSAGPEVTVDAMLRGEGHAVLGAEQLGHLVAGMVPPPAVLQLVAAEQLAPMTLLTLVALLDVMGYQVEM